MGLNKKDKQMIRGVISERKQIKKIMLKIRHGHKLTKGEKFLLARYRAWLLKG